MERIYQVSHYPTSKDYDHLFALMKKTSIICIVDYGKTSRDVAHTIYRENDYSVSARGIGYIWSDSKEDFIAQCTGCNLEFIVPDLS